MATYDYLGAGHLVGTTLDQANLNTSVFAESGGTHTYTDLDEFNRPTRWNWERVGGASGGFYNTVIAYDENSNPVSTTDAGGRGMELPSSRATEVGFATSVLSEPAGLRRGRLHLWNAQAGVARITPPAVPLALPGSGGVASAQLQAEPLSRETAGPAIR